MSRIRICTPCPKLSTAPPTRTCSAVTAVTTTKTATPRECRTALPSRTPATRLASTTRATTSSTTPRRTRESALDTVSAVAAVTAPRPTTTRANSLFSTTRVSHPACSAAVSRALETSRGPLSSTTTSRSLHRRCMRATNRLGKTGLRDRKDRRDLRDLR